MMPNTWEKIPTGMAHIRVVEKICDFQPMSHSILKWY